MRTHDLKTLDAYFDAVKDGSKTFEVRRDDRGFNKGDAVLLRRYGEDAFGKLTFKRYRHDALGCAREQAETLKFTIGWVLTGGQFGIEPGFVVFSLAPPAKEGER